MKLDDLIKRAVEVRAKYDEYNARRGASWDETDLMSGFVGDVGDLSKIIMAKKGLRDMDNVDEKLAHELSDCLWSIFVLADKFKIDLENEFQVTMNELEGRIEGLNHAK